MDIHILYNNCYGGFFPSEQAIKLYNVRRTAIDPEFKAILYGNEFQRHDPILVHIFIELGEDFGHSFSKTAIYTCGKEYERYYEIRDYDGMERVSIDINRYRLDKVQSILGNDKTTKDETIGNLKQVFTGEKKECL